MGSSIWPSQCTLYGHIMHQCRWIVGKGDNIWFWHENWINSPNINLIMSSFTISNLLLMVLDCLCGDQSWDIDLDLSFTCPQSVEQIEAVEVASIPDQLVWSLTSTSLISCKNYYLHLLGNLHDPLFFGPSISLILAQCYVGVWAWIVFLWMIG